MSSLLKHSIRLALIAGVLGTLGFPCGALAQQSSRRKPQPPAPPAVDPATLPPGIQEMMRGPGGSAQSPAPARAAKGKKALGNEDFGAPPADVVRERLLKQAEEQAVQNEEQWREAVKAARAEVESARMQAEEARKAQAAAAAEAPPAPETAPAQPDPVKRVLEIADAVNKGQIDPTKAAPAELPKQAQPPTPPPPPPVDPVQAAQDKLDRLMAIGRDRNYSETPKKQGSEEATPTTPKKN